MKYLYILFGIFISINAQGWIDTRYSDFQTGSYDAEVYVSRRLQTEVNPTDSGCIEYHVRFDVNNDGWYDLVSADWAGPNLRIWLGSASGYSSTSSLTYPITVGGNCDMSDLNIDNYAELIHSGHGMYNCYIYWGTASGPSASSPTTLWNDGSEAVYIADFDKDTYLDIVLATNDQGLVLIYWGIPGGPHGIQYSVTDTTVIRITGRLGHNMEASDLDRNGFLDLIVAGNGATYILYQQSARKFTLTGLTFATLNYSHGLSIGDFNKDGYLDIVSTGFKDITYSSIYWGTPSGYSDAAKSNFLPGRCYGGSGVGDFNKDGWLDIIYYRGNGGENPPYTDNPIIYKNSGTFPFFSDGNTTKIGVSFNASGGVVADFNKDGELDVFVNNYTASSYSYVFFGPGFSMSCNLPVQIDHHGSFRDPRQLNYYYSPVVKPCTLGVDTLIINGTCNWLANILGNSRVDIAIRTGNTAVPDTSWTAWYAITSNPGTFNPAVLYKKYIQYRAGLYWENPGQLPNLEKIEVCPNCGGSGVNEQRLQENIFSIRTIHKRLIINTSDCREVEIYNISGRMISSFSLSAGSFETELKNSGIYWVRDKRSRVAKKVLVL